MENRKKDTNSLEFKQLRAEHAISVKMYAICLIIMGMHIDIKGDAIPGTKTETLGSSKTRMWNKRDSDS